MSDGTIKDPKVKDVSNTIKARYDCGIENQKSVGCMVLEPVICRSVGRDPDNPSNREKGLMYEDYRIRKLTPRECFRLMGFTDTDFDKIHGISNTQLYKMAGNSIVVNVLEAIFKQLFKENHKE